jgi:hypothetical protein
MKISELLGNKLTEMATGGGTSSGAIASVSNPFGITMRRPSLFGYVASERKKHRKKRKHK